MWTIKKKKNFISERRNFIHKRDIIFCPNSERNNSNFLSLIWMFRLCLSICTKRLHSYGCDEKVARWGKKKNFQYKNVFFFFRTVGTGWLRLLLLLLCYNANVCFLLLDVQKKNCIVCMVYCGCSFVNNDLRQVWT